MSLPSSQTAVEQVRAELTQLRRQRMLAAMGYTALLAGLVLLFFIVPEKPGALAHDMPWTFALALMFGSSAISAAATIGYPFFSRKVLTVVGGFSALGLIGALFMVTDFNASAGPALARGAPCMLFGTVVSLVAMFGLGVVSGRLWRKFPDPSLVMALGLTAVGVTALHFRCGGADPMHLFGFHLAPLVIIYLLARLAIRTKNDLSKSEA